MLLKKLVTLALSEHGRELTPTSFHKVKGVLPLLIEAQAQRHRPGGDKELCQARGLPFTARVFSLGDQQQPTSVLLSGDFSDSLLSGEAFTDGCTHLPTRR